MGQVHVLLLRVCSYMSNSYLPISNVRVSYLSGNKRYIAHADFGYETPSLDLETNATRTAPCDHITRASIEATLSQFCGTIAQIPPVYSAIWKDGKRMHEAAREGATAEDMNMQARPVEIYDLTLVDVQMPRFTLDIKCGGGTYVRSLIRDVAYSLDTLATMTQLQRTQQGPFTLENSMELNQLNPDTLCREIDKWNVILQSQSSTS
jgi:tRNA pseudouridine55 synthase